MEYTQLQSEIEQALTKAVKAESNATKHAYLELAFALKRQGSWLRLAAD